MDWWNNLQNEWNNFWDFTHGGQPWSSAPTPPPVQQAPAPSQPDQPNIFQQLGGDIGQGFSNLGTTLHTMANTNIGGSPHTAPPIHENLTRQPLGSPPPFIHTPHGPYYHPAFHPATGVNPHAMNAQTANLDAPTPTPVGAAHGVQIG